MKNNYLAIFVFGILFASIITMNEMLGLIATGAFIFMAIYSKDFRKKFDTRGKK